MPIIVFFILKVQFFHFIFCFLFSLFNLVNIMLFYGGFGTILLFLVIVLPILLLVAVKELRNYRRNSDP